MKLSPFATAAWLLWLAAITLKIGIAIAPVRAKQIFRYFLRAAVTIVGVTVARATADSCSDDAHLASTFLAGVAITAIVADAASFPVPQRKTTPGTAAILSAAVVAVAEIVLRSPRRCYTVAAPVLSVATVLAVCLSSALVRI